MTKPKVLLLDLGNVVFELDWQRPVSMLRLEESKLEKILLKQLQVWGPYDQYERGKISTDEFLVFINQNTDKKITKEEFTEAWHSLIPGYFLGMGELLGELSQKVPLFALTNTNPLHYDFIVSQFQEMKLFQKIFSSIHTGFRKPEREIFETVLEELDTDPKDILYIDDTEAHVLAAKSYGFTAEHYLGRQAGDLKQLLWKYQL